MSNTPLPADRWLSALESRRGLLTGAVLIVCVAMILVTAMRNPVDYDGYWHLRMGMDWVQNGLSPFVDHYSFTYPNANISGVPFVFQLGLYGMVNLFGVQGGMIATKLVLFLFVFACMIVWLERIKAPVLGYMLGLAALVVGLQFRAQLRPELLTYGFVIIAVILYQRANTQANARTILPIAALMVIWGNYHSPILGFVIFFGLFVDIALRLIRERKGINEWLAWAIWGAVTLGTGYLRPGFHHPMIGIGRFMEKWNHLIQEYLPPTFLLDSPSGYFVILIVAVTLIGLVAQKKVGLTVVTLVMAYYASNMARLVAPTLILCATLLPLIIRDFQKRSVTGAATSTIPASVTSATVVMIAGTLLLGVLNTRAFMKENLISWTLFPAQLVSYFEQSGQSGRVFNDYEIGGYLLYKLSPESKIYIDGRSNILYPLEHYQRYLRTRSDPDFFLEEADRLGFDYAILRSNEDTIALMSAAGWSLEYNDINFVLFQPLDGHLHHFGKLWGEPYCWNAEIENALPNELAHIKLGTGAVTPSTPLMHYSLAYASASDRVSFLEKSATGYDYDDAGRRFLAGRALNEGVYGSAITLSKDIESRTPLDDLVPPIAFAKQGEWLKAQRAMETALGHKWRVILNFEKELQLQVLGWLEANHELSPSLQQSLVRLEGELGAITTGRPVDISDFCAL